MSSIHPLMTRVASTSCCGIARMTARRAAAGWVREPGRGRLCHLANGHTLEALLHPMYQRLLGNAVQWCLRREAAAGPPHADVKPAADERT